MSNTSLEREKGDILIVDDNLPNIQALSEILAGEGFAVRGARERRRRGLARRARAADRLEEVLEARG